MNKKETEIMIERMEAGTMPFWIKGSTPLIYNAMSSKAMRTILAPKKKTAADKAQTEKHNPLEEFVNSTYRQVGSGPTRLIFPSCAIKRAIMNAALDVPGAKKTEMGRLIWVVGDTVDVYGVPKILMSVVRCADMSHTPDIRTRAIVPEWCLKAQIRFVMPNLNETTVSRLIETAGMVNGLGDWRQQKGSANYGQFSMVNESECKSIIKDGGMKAQDDALSLKTPEFYDVETEQLWTWWNEEMKRRGRQ